MKRTVALVEITRRAAVVTARLEEEAYGTIEPAVTRDSDVARYLKQRMRLRSRRRGPPRGTVVREATCSDPATPP